MYTEVAQKLGLSLRLRRFCIALGHDARIFGILNGETVDLVLHNACQRRVFCSRVGSAQLSSRVHGRIILLGIDLR